MLKIYALFLLQLFHLLPALGQVESEEENPGEDDSTLTGDWGGLRSRIEDKGIKPEVIYTFLPIANMSGGKREGLIWMDNLDFSVGLDGEALFNLHGSSAFFYLLNNNGQQLTPLVGDLQEASNIETTTRFQMYEAWIQQNFFADKLSLLIGKYDLNAEFDFVRPGLLFLNSSFGIGHDYAQSGAAGPSIFPYTSLAARIAWQPNDRIKFQGMIADAVPKYSDLSEENQNQEGLFSTFEIWYFHVPNKIELEEGGVLFRRPASRRNRTSRSALDTQLNRITMGVWSYTDPFPVLDGAGTGKPFENSGIYISGQQYFHKDNNYLALFLRAGLANSRFNQTGSSYSGGANASLAIKGIRTQYGLAFSHARNGAHYMEMNPSRPQLEHQAETVIEATAGFILWPGVNLQPNLQWIINPGTDPQLKNTTVFSIMTELTL